MNLRSVISEITDVRRKHMSKEKGGIPMNTNIGFKEANLVHAASLVLQNHDFLCFPEFPYAKGSIDALFVKNEEIIITEFKRLNLTTAQSIIDQNKRMMNFDPDEEMEKHYFKPQKWKVTFLWICDAWETNSVGWWMGKSNSIKLDCPFDKSWKKGNEDFRSEMQKHEGVWNPYYILWAFKENENKRLTERRHA